MQLTPGVDVYPLPHDFSELFAASINGVPVLPITNRDMVNNRADFMGAPDWCSVFPPNGPGEPSVLRVWPCPDRSYDMKLAYYTAPKDA